MTKTYNDIEAVTTLLEEKERDLELAARIGQSLLERNKELENKNAEYETQLTEANDKIKQLRHDISQKEALLQMYMHDEESPTTPEDERLQLSVGVLNAAGLQRKIQSLQDENFSLVKQTATLQTETCLLEEKEQSLFKDCVGQLEEYKNQVLHLQDELITKSDISLRQQEEITSLTSVKVTLDAQNKKLQEQQAETTKNLETAQLVQGELTDEIGELECRNEELEMLLREYQEEIKSLKKKQKPGFIRHHASYNSPFLPEGSLALELEDSLRHDVDCPPGYTANDRRQHSNRVMRTARAARSRNSRHAVKSPTDSTNGNESAISSYMSYQSSMCAIGRPGIPGSNDLEVALKRLTMKQTNDSHEKRKYQYSDDTEATPCRTPDSMMSLSSYGNMSDMSRLSTNSSYRIPEKLQIVKPLEGSQTLHHWKRLATPHLGGVLEHRPGIQNKGEGPADSEQEETYSLSDYEEDDDYSLHLGKCMEQTCGVYTFTTAKVLHPDDEFNNSINRLEGVTPPVAASHTRSTRSSTVSYCSLNDHGTSTFSMSTGLAHGLHERGLHGNTPVKQPPAISRYGNIVTETISGETQSQTQVLYSTAGSVSSVSRSSGTTATDTLLNTDADNAYLMLADKVKDIGLNAILGIAKKSGIAPVQLDPVDTGLNAIMSIKRNKGAVNRGMAEKASQSIVYARIPKRNVKKVENSVRTSSMVVTNSTRVIMAAPLPTSKSGTFVPELSSTPKVVKSPDDMDLLRTLPSVIVSTSTQQRVQRPSSLPLSSAGEAISSICAKNNISLDSGSQSATGCSSMAVTAYEHDPAAELHTDSLSSGLLRHLSSIYTKTRDVIGAPAAALSSTIYQNDS